MVTLVSVIDILDSIPPVIMLFEISLTRFPVTTTFVNSADEEQGYEGLLQYNPPPLAVVGASALLPLIVTLVKVNFLESL
jgi:hypothetical protein